MLRMPVPYSSLKQAMASFFTPSCAMRSPITAPCTASGATVRKKYGSMPESVIDVDAIEITGIFSATMLL